MYTDTEQEVLMSSDVLEADGTVTHYTKAVKLRQEQTVSVGTGVGWSGGTFSANVMPDLFFISGTALPSPDGYSLCISMLLTLRPTHTHTITHTHTHTHCNTRTHTQQHTHTHTHNTHTL